MGGVCEIKFHNNENENKEKLKRELLSTKTLAPEGPLILNGVTGIAVAKKQGERIELSQPVTKMSRSAKEKRARNIK